MNDPRFRRPVSQYSSEWTHVRHYYGDIVRIIFVAIAVLIGATVPLSGNVPLGVLFGAPAAITLVALAGFTNPHGRVVFMLSAVVSAIGVVLSEGLAVVAYSTGPQVAFVLLEIVCALFVAALYFSVKNMRAAMMHKIGKVDGVGEFDEQQR